MLFRSVSQSRYEEQTNTLQSKYGYTWRGIKRELDRQHGIAGGELLVIDLSTNDVMGVRRGFLYGSHKRGNLEKFIRWESALFCPSYLQMMNERRRALRLNYIFVSKVLSPAKIYEMDEGVRYGN